MMHERIAPVVERGDGPCGPCITAGGHVPGADELAEFDGNETCGVPRARPNASLP